MGVVSRIFTAVCLLAAAILQLADQNFDALWWLGLAIFNNTEQHSREARP